MERSRWKKVFLGLSISIVILLGIAFAQQVTESQNMVRDIKLCKHYIAQEYVDGPYSEVLSQARKILAFEILSSIGTLLAILTLVGANVYIWKYREPLTAEERAERKLQKQEARKERKRRKLQAKMNKLQ